MKQFRHALPTAPARWVLLVWAVLFGALPGQMAARQLISAEEVPGGLILQVSDGELAVHALSDQCVEVVFTSEGAGQPPSYALANPQERAAVSVEETADAFRIWTNLLHVLIRKDPVRVQFFRDQELLIEEEEGYAEHAGMVGFRLRVDPHEVLMGGGSRVLGMNRRGHLLDLYNKPSYGYETEAPLMYYSLPMVVSGNRTAVVFDNGARGQLDLGHTQPDILAFRAEGGRRSYFVVAGRDWPDLMHGLTGVTGRQPLPPRWALGNISSRMGYRSQAEVEWVASGYAVKDIPVDAMVIDLFWFGPDLKGHMGNLAWDRNTFPEPEQMMARLKEQGIQTVLITEPFILTSSNRFTEVVGKQLLGTTAQGDPYTYDFYFGTTGLLDIFKPQTRDWFWEIYRDLTASGVAGWWGDLGEPEVHPDDLFHSIGQATEVHNLYGHEWARLVAEGFARDFPDQRPLNLMRAGFVGSQRYGMIPWSGDVNRTWGGLQPQVEIALQMGLQGLGYMHSDLGGFAGNGFDPELYARWLQYGAFQPVYRPHAQEAVPPEPIFWDTDTLALVRPFIKLRYAMAPYNYTLAYENSATGLPLMRPLFFADDDPALLLRSDGYLWGDAFLVYPVTAPGTEEMAVTFPGIGTWFNFFTGQRHEGGTSARVPTPPDQLPVFVRAGAWVPMIPPVHSLSAYPYDQLIAHYWHDASIPESAGQLYEDDGLTPDAASRGLSEWTRFASTWDAGDKRLRLRISRDGTSYPGRAAQRTITWVVHQLDTPPSAVTLHGQPDPLPFSWDPQTRQLRFTTQLTRLNQTVLVQLP